jgi:RNA polymerase sigma-70 factor (ECF subfamily)
LTDRPIHPVTEEMIMAAMTDDMLVAASQNGDAASFQDLFARYSDQVKGIARGILKSERDAEDVVQETFLSVHQNLDNFRGDAKFSTWLRRIAINRSLMTLRKQKRRRESQADDHVVESRLSDIQPARTPNDEYRENEFLGRVQEALDKLERSEREILEMRILEERSIAEIAVHFGISKAATKSRLHRARLSLREYLADFE